MADELEESDRRALRRMSDRRKIQRCDNARRFAARSAALLQFSGIRLDANGTCLCVALR
jgi:hypothetical protein